MMTPKTISFRADAARINELDAVAKSMQRDRSFLLNQAINFYLHEQRRFKELVEVGLAASESGQVVDDDDVMRRIDSWSAKPLALQTKATRTRAK